ncbi:MAG: SdpI family protein [Candidatus Diapherotrites archaeon]
MKRPFLLEFMQVLLIVMIFVSAFAAYSFMPALMVTHWNIAGEADGFMSKAYALFLIPVMIVILYLVLWVVPKIDPLKKNIQLFRREYDIFRAVFIFFMVYLYLLSIFWNLGKRFDFVVMLVPGFSLLFYFCGFLISKAKRNYLIGIRLPWTLASDEVWNKTHKMGGKLFRLYALILLLGIVLPEFFFWILFVPLILILAWSVLYSYFEFRELEEKEKKKK